MKKTAIACALLATFVGGSAQAATVLGFKMGGDYWRADTSGSFADATGTEPQQTFDYSEGNQGSFWFAVEHPVPIIPNLKVRQNQLDATGSANVNKMAFGDKTFEGDITSNTNLSNTDFVLYYELLDNDVVALDIGAAYKKMNGSMRVNQIDTSGVTRQNAELSLTSGVVMAYADAQVGIPGLGLYGFADVMVGMTETGVHDITVGLGWKIEGDALDTKLRLGYRDFNFDVNNFDGITANTKFQGYFAGVELVF